MSYQHIDNLYKEQKILLFRECYALEKIHGTSAHLTWNTALTFSPGGEDAASFKALFDQDALRTAFEAMGHPSVVVYGEAHGGKRTGQAWRYGPDLRFVAFEVRVGDSWPAVPQAESVVHKLGLTFVPYERCSTDLEALDAQRDAPSVQARRNGVVGDQPREGVVLRPLLELRTNDGKRIVCKHKGNDARETTTPRPVVDPATLVILTDAEAVAEEWVTPTRLEHVIDQLAREGESPIAARHAGPAIEKMMDDVLREAKGEISESVAESKALRVAIGRRTMRLLKDKLARDREAT